MDVLIQFGIVIALALIGLVFGSINEQRHYRSIRQREARLKRILVFNEKQTPRIASGQPFYLVQGSVVISSDYFKTLAAGLRNLFGGNLRMYERLLDRARREAVLRMKEQARAHGATLIVNVLFETSSLKQPNQRGVVCCEVLVYGTAFVLPQSQSRKPKARLDT